MKYFIETKSHEYIKFPFFKRGIYNIELISIGVVSGIIEENMRFNEKIEEYNNEHKDINLYKLKPSREYSAINKEFDIRIAWKNKNIRENILKPIHYELAKKGVDFNCSYVDWVDIITSRDNGFYDNRHYKTLKKLIKKYGKTQKQIATEIQRFIYHPALDLDDGMQNLDVYVEEWLKTNKIEFYSINSNYDWVILTWLSGKKDFLPKGFPEYIYNLNQLMNDKWNPFRSDYHRPEAHRDYPDKIIGNNTLEDAKRAYKLYEFIKII